MDSEISGLEDLHAFLKLGNYVTRFSFPVHRHAPEHRRHLSRDRWTDDELAFDPKTLKAKQADVTKPIEETGGRCAGR